MDRNIEMDVYTYSLGVVGIYIAIVERSGHKFGGQYAVITRITGTDCILYVLYLPCTILFTYIKMSLSEVTIGHLFHLHFLRSVRRAPTSQDSIPFRKITNNNHFLKKHFNNPKEIFIINRKVNQT